MNKKVLAITVTLVCLGVAAFASANHSWGGYHWARTSNTFTLKLGDNVSSAWDPYLATTSADWSQSSVLDTTIVPGQARINCKPTSGRVEVCNRTYGNNGWLGIAQIWISGSHITQATTKMNDTYFNTPTYNNPAWRQFVVCQEVGHTFGLDHQDEAFNNTNLGTCMDYTNDPAGTIYNQLSNLHPNLHDYQELEAIYGHQDTNTTVSQKTTNGNANNVDSDDVSNWGKEVRKDAKNHTSLFEKDLGMGNKIVTFVIWVNE